MMKSASTIEEYITLYPAKTQQILKKIRTTIRKLIPQAEEAMKYGIPTFRLKQNLVHFAAYEHHIGFYPTAAVIEAFGRKIKNYKSSKGAVQFPLEEPIPYELIIEMTKFRIDQYNSSYVNSKSKKK